jgi:hypothetical protein
VLIDAEDLYVALADADASASTAYLQEGLEPAALRDRYTADLRRAGQRLAALSAQELPPESRPAIEAIASALPVYAGHVETARTNSRLGYPLGAAYLRRGSDLMRTTMLPAATSLYKQAAARLERSYGAGSTPSHEVAVLVLGTLAVSALLAAQVLLSWRTRRVLNIGLVVATVAVAAVGLWTLRAFDVHEQALSRSQRHGSDPLTVLSTARIQALRSLGYENLNLIERGTEPAYQREFADVTESIRSSDRSTGLLATAERLARARGTTNGIDVISSHFDDYLAAHEQVRQLNGAGSYYEAVDAAVTDEARAAAKLDRALATEISAARGRLEAYAREARSGLQVIAVAIVLLTAIAAILAIVGLQHRLREYR